MPPSERSRSVGPTLLTLCLLLLHHEASSYNLTIADLPPTKQQSKRLLAAITVSDNSTSYFITKQLLSYAEACEAGFEVHVILITGPGVWDNADKILFPTPSRYYCLRLQMLLPVAVASDLPDGLAHQHRHAFSRLVHKYDLFLSQEHDMNIQARHLLYWTRWRHFFQTHPSVPRSDKPIIPGFLRHEVSMRQHKDKVWLQPSPLIHLHAPLSLLSIGNATCFAPFNSYPGLFLTDRPMLQLAMSKQAWTTDARKSFNDPTTHHQSHWQWYYFHQAIPLAAMHDAMVHHGADKHAPPEIETTAGFSDWQYRDAGQDGGTDAVELEYLITNCLGQPWDSSRLPFPYPSLQGRNTVVSYGACSGWLPRWVPNWVHTLSGSGCLGSNPDSMGGKGPTPCAECAAQGKGVALTYRLSGPTLAARPLKAKALFMVDAECIERLTTQELMACSNEGCDDYYVNASNSSGMKLSRRLRAEGLGLISPEE